MATIIAEFDRGCVISSEAKAKMVSYEIMLFTLTLCPSLANSTTQDHYFLYLQKKL